MKGQVVRFAIPVCISDVVDGADGQDHLSHGVDDGQVNNCPAQRLEGEERRTSLQRDKIYAGSKLQQCTDSTREDHAL